MNDNKKKVMIRIKNAEKIYRLGQIGSGSLQRDLQSWWAAKRGLPDPNLKIGQSERLEGDRLYALRDIDLTVYKGECLGIIGGNGAGKSTLLKLISRVTAPTAGSIDLYGRVTSMLEVGTGFNGEMTGLENIYLNGAILGMSRKETDEVLEEIIEFSGVREFIDTPVKRYSSGMYVRLGFAVAAHLKSEIVIMDEVLAVGDIDFQRKCIKKMREAAAEEGRTILYVSHNMNTVKSLCSRCIVLDGGRIIYDGDTGKAIDHYRDYLLNDMKRNTAAEERRDKNITGKCCVQNVTVKNRNLECGGTLEFCVTADSAEDIENARIRLVVCDITGSVIGMAYSGPHFLKRGITELNCSFGTDPLAPGEYFCDIAVFEYEDGVQIRHDFVSKVMGFTIVSSRYYFGKEWKKQNWGYVRLSPVYLEDKEPNDGRSRE